MYRSAYFAQENSCMWRVKYVREQLGRSRLAYLSIPNIVSLEPLGYPTLCVHQP